MKLKALLAAMIAGGLIAGAWAKGPTSKTDFSGFKREIAEAKADISPPITIDVGDPDSFGRSAKYIGLMSSGTITLAADCTPDPEFPPGPEDHCFVVIPGGPAASFRVADAARMLIPAKSSNSLFCHMQTPAAVTQLHNPGSYPLVARIFITPSYTFQNEVLNDPKLIDPTTGQPFNGQLTRTLAGIRHQLTLQPGEIFVGRNSETRSCIGGLISKRQLIDGFGLSEAQAIEFFAHDTIVTMSVNVNAQGVDFSNLIVGTRWLGD